MAYDPPSSPHNMLPACSHNNKQMLKLCSNNNFWAPSEDDKLFSLFLSWWKENSKRFMSWKWFIEDWTPDLASSDHFNDRLWLSTEKHSSTIQVFLAEFKPENDRFGLSDENYKNSRVVSGLAWPCEDPIMLIKLVLQFPLWAIMNMIQIIINKQWLHLKSQIENTIYIYWLQNWYWAHHYQ